MTSYRNVAAGAAAAGESTTYLDDLEELVEAVDLLHEHRGQRLHAALVVQLEHVLLGLLDVEFVDDLLEDRLRQLEHDLVVRLAAAAAAQARLHVQDRRHQRRRLLNLASAEEQ